MRNKWGRHVASPSSVFAKFECQVSDAISRVWETRTPGDILRCQSITYPSLPCVSSQSSSKTVIELGAKETQT